MTPHHPRVEHATRAVVAGAGGPLDPLDLRRLIASGLVDIIDGDPLLAITVIRLAEADLPVRQDDDMPPGLAVLLMSLYTGVGDTVLSLGDDPVIEGVCGGGGRRYLCVADRGEVSGLERVSGRVALIIIRWPYPLADNGTAMPGLLTRCRRLLAPDGKLIVAVLGDGANGHVYVRAAEHLLPAALAAGLDYFRRFVAVFAPILGERGARHASPAGGAAMRQANHLTVHRDIVVLSVRQRGRHA